MKNDQKTLNDRTLLGLNKRTPSPKPKKERILETVNRIISRIQNDQRNYKWRNTLTRLAWECLKSWETQWPSYVKSIKLMNQTLWDVLLLSLFRHILTPLILITDLCSSDLYNTHGHPSDITSRIRHHWVSFGVFFFASLKV